MWLTLQIPQRADTRVLAEVMHSSEDRHTGMMFRHHFPDDRLMLFMYPENGVHRVWMKNCHFPLDVVWLDRAGRVVDSVRNLPPCKGQPCPIYGKRTPTRHFLEGTAGWLARYGVTEGTLVRLGPLLPAAPHRPRLEPSR